MIGRAEIGDWIKPLYSAFNEKCRIPNLFNQLHGSLIYIVFMLLQNINRPLSGVVPFGLGRDVDHKSREKLQNQRGTYHKFCGPAEGEPLMQQEHGERNDKAAEGKTVPRVSGRESLYIDKQH